MDKTEILASQVGIPWRRKRTFVVGTKGILATKGKVAVWKRRWEKVKQPVQELGKFLGRRGAYFLKRGNGKRAIHMFNEPIISSNRAHIMGENPIEGCIAHPADAARLEKAEELHTLRLRQNHHRAGTLRDPADGQETRSVTFQRSSTTSHRTGGFEPNEREILKVRRTGNSQSGSP